MSTKRLLAGFLFFLVLGIIVLFAPLGPVLSFWVETRLEEAMDARIAIDGLDIRLYGRASADRVTIEPKGAMNEPIVLDDIRVVHRFSGLLKGRYQIEQLSVGHAAATAREGLFQWASGLRGESVDSPVFPELEIAGGRIDIPGLKRPILLERVRVSARQRDDHRFSGRILFSAGKNDVNLAFNADFESGFVETDLSLIGFDFSFLPVFDASGFEFDPAKIKVNGGLSGTVTYLMSTGQWVGDLALTGITGGHRDYGLIITNGRSRIQIADRRVTFHGTELLTAEGRITIPDAEVFFDKNGIAGASAKGSAEDMDLAELEKLGIFNLLPQYFQPGKIDTGKVDAVMSGTWNPDDHDFYADMEIKEASGTLKYPEVKFSSLGAGISLEKGGLVTVKHAGARFWEGQAAAVGSLEIIEGDVENPHFDISFENVVKNDTLMALLPEEVIEGIGFAGLSYGAKAGGNIQLAGEAVALEVNIQAKKLAPPDLPLEFEEVTGTVKWHTDAPSVVFKDVSGKTNGSRVRGEGALLIEDDLYRADFNIIGEDLRLNRDILDWLDINPGLWQIEGNMDVVLQAQDWRPAEDSVFDSLSGLKAEMVLKNIAFTHKNYGRAAELLNGRLYAGHDGFELAHFNGSVFGVSLEGSGRFPAGDKGVNPVLFMEAEEVVLSPSLLARLPFDTGFIEEISGRANIVGRVEALYAEDGLEFTGDFIAHLDRAEITAVGFPAGASGFSRLQFSNGELVGNVSFYDVTIAKVTGDRLLANFQYKPPVIDFKSIGILAYGGRINFEHLQVNRLDQSWSTKFDVSRLDLENVSKTHDIFRKQAPEGVFRSRISLEGKSFDVETIKGRGDVEIGEGRLYSFPLLVAILSLFDLRIPTQNPITDAYGLFNIENGLITIEDLLFTGGSVPIYMEGHIGMRRNVELKDQPINLIVTLARREGILDRIPLVSILKHYTVDFLRRIFLQARVTGTIDDYRVATISTPITDQIQKMFSFLEKVASLPRQP